MEKINQKNNPPEENFNEIEIENETRKEQIVEGPIEDVNNWKKSLPDDVDSHMVEQFLGQDNKWYWHLKPEYIKDKNKRKEYYEKRKVWP